MIVLLDTDVLVDCLRGTPSAQAWLASVEAEPFQVPGIVAMELLMGCHNQAELRRIQKFLHTFAVVWPEATEFARAYDLLAAHRLASGLSIPDCLIAAMTLSRSARLYTFNLKHFRIIDGLDVQEPYART
ncbi:MAG: PIN domain-containing protein [Phycisphaerae bacterium]|nr:PIN domain-containing protein [Phycisphaerae bacterium]